MSKCAPELIRGAHAPGSGQHRIVAVYFEAKAVMAVNNLAEVINSLPPAEQESVKLFVEFLQRKGSAPASPFLAAVDEFVEQHPELLRRLAQ